MFKSIQDLKSWLKVQYNDKVDCLIRYKISIYKCELSGNLKSGVWDCATNIETVTGDYLTILEKVKLENIWPELQLKYKKG